MKKLVAFVLLYSSRLFISFQITSKKTSRKELEELTLVYTMKTIYGVLFVSAVLALSTAKEASIWDALRDLDDASDVNFEIVLRRKCNAASVVEPLAGCCNQCCCSCKGCNKESEKKQNSNDNNSASYGSEGSVEASNDGNNQ